MSVQENRSLTTVIPAYNVGSYIGACIASVLSQQRCTNGLQVIVVVDGATDNTLEQARHASQGYEDTVRIVAQENSGLSGARNAGLDLVETEYVTFLDGDDVWLENYLEMLEPLLLGGDADLIEYDALRIDESGAPIDVLKIAAAQEGSSMEISRDELLTIFRCYAWARVYRTALVRKHRYPVGRRFEDTAATPWHYWNSCRSLSIGIPLIGYRQRPQSILTTPLQQDIVDIAANTAEASAMYIDTRVSYWQSVAHRSFQQGCRRTILLPLGEWPASLRLCRAAIRGVPPPPGFSRWLQMRATLFYVSLIWLKHKLLRD
jgi:glycosyltransferase involved in cell wall biosynthesis